MTSLVSLDLSYNEFAVLTHASNTKLPFNLTTLNIAHNYITKLPIKVLIKQKTLKLLDVRFNLLPIFWHELLTLIENGTEVLYSGKNIFKRRFTYFSFFH